MQLLEPKDLSGTPARVIILKKDDDVEAYGLDQKQLNYLRDFQDKLDQPEASRYCQVNDFPQWFLFVFPDLEAKGSKRSESFRQDGVEIRKWANNLKITDLSLEANSPSDERLFQTAEGLMLSNYQFLPYISEKKKKANSLVRMAIVSENQNRMRELKAMVSAVSFTRDLVNEPLSTLNAPKLAEEVEKTARQVGLKVEVFDKQKIESLKMGGLLAVNRGSIDPPRFIILEYIPEKAVNEKPLVLVGKGIVYDTGGLSLKPTPNSMDYMKSDMAGGAAVAGTLYALSALNIPVRSIGLIPATDNRPDGNAYAPGDVIQMHSGLSVEVLNTDAEGRLILADALSYARKYNPDLVIDLATLTGAAAVAVGNIGTVVMGTAEDSVMNDLQFAGDACYERTVKFPLWEEYGKLLESSIADIKNIGGREAGAITAGKFLEKFTDYPWIHMDIAGPSFLFSEDGYRTQGGTGTGVRLLVEFVKKHYLK